MAAKLFILLCFVAGALAQQCQPCERLVPGTVCFDDAFAAAPSSLLRLHGRRWSHHLICVCFDPVITRTPDTAYIFCSAAAVFCCLPFPCCPASAVFAAAQGILKLAGMDDNCQQLLTIQECTAKMQMTVSQQCMVQLQPDLPVAQDGSFCSPSKGVNARGGGQQVLWRTDLRMHTHPTPWPDRQRPPFPQHSLSGPVNSSPTSPCPGVRHLSLCCRPRGRPAHAGAQRLAVCDGEGRSVRSVQYHMQPQLGVP